MHAFRRECWLATYQDACKMSVCAFGILRVARDLLPPYSSQATKQRAETGHQSTLAALNKELAALREQAGQLVSGRGVLQSKLLLGQTRLALAAIENNMVV